LFPWRILIENYLSYRTGTLKKLYQNSFLPPAAKGGSFEKPPPLESPVKLFIRPEPMEMITVGHEVSWQVGRKKENGANGKYPYEAWYDG
jgi:hypothetical protein